MPKSNILNQLRSATLVEREEASAHRARYQTLTAKINDYEMAWSQRPRLRGSSNGVKT